MTRNAVLESDLAGILSAPLPWERLDGKTVLISGASGFLPALMAETLLARNERSLGEPTTVIALVRDRQKAEKRFAAYQGRPDLQFLVQDVCQVLAIPQPVQGIIHAASQASPKYYGVDPVGTLSANVQGTQNLLELARQHGAGLFLYFSSSEVYGQVTDAQVPTREDQFGSLDPTHVRSCYAESKRMGETLCVSYAHQYGVPAKIVRPFHTYGPGMALDDGRVFADFVSDIVHRRNIVLKSDGTATRAFCYLADAVLGYFTVLLNGAVGMAYNVGNDKTEISIRDLAQTLVTLFPERGLHVVQTDPKPGGDYLQSPVSRSCPDIAKIRTLGWEPRTGIAEGFRRTVESFEAQQ